MGLDAIEALLKESIGLDVASVGHSSIERAVATRVSACGVADADEYVELVRHSGIERQALIEAVVVPETWFFRDAEAFALLARVALDEWMPTRGARRLRILSVPSSTGEEPYSIVMALLEAGLAPDAFDIDAVDVSALALARAIRGHYGRNSFRGRDLNFRDRHFDVVDGGYRVSDRVRAQARFRQANLFALDVPLGTAIYDAIFCRNLMIYFDRDTQERAIRTLDRRLAPHGLLFVAPSEAAVMLNHGFATVKAPLSFAFRKPGQERRVKPARAASRPRAVFPRPRTLPVATLADPDPAPASPAPERMGPHPEVLLDEATTLADQGRLEEAARHCETHLQRRGPSVRAFYLLGTVRDAAGDAHEAAACYRKALYLDPHHREVLVHLALIMEKLGKRADAQRLRERASRAGAGVESR